MNKIINDLNAYLILFLTSILVLFNSIIDVKSQTGGLLPVVDDSLRGRIDAERLGHHDFNRIRTRFYNYGMVGDYPPDPIKVDLTTFHSVEIPKGSGENYSDGITPFVLAKVTQTNGNPAYIFESGYRERQDQSPITGKTMRYEPRPGYFQTDPLINKGRSPALSNDPRTWPDEWIDKVNDPTDPGWSGAWNGYFGKAPKLEMQESFCVYDDDFYDAWNYFPDSRDQTRRGLGLRVEQRGFQWNNPQAGNVIFFHYDISNESTTDYNDNIIFGLYMDSGVGGSGKGRDPYPESDDDNAYFDRETDLNLVYTWDFYGHGVKGPTGYLGYSYLETPSHSTNLLDDDGDGITNERRDAEVGTLLQTQDEIRAYVNTHYNLVKFQQFYGPLENRYAFQRAYWWTGDEDLDWIAEFHDTGADGVFGTNDLGERDGKPTQGEPYFGKTDIDESDQIGLTAFKYNRINDPAGGGATDNIVFFNDGRDWPRRLYENIFTQPDSAFEPILTRTNINIGFLFASGPFILAKGQNERFSLALAYGQDLRELKSNVRVVQKIYKANYQFSVPPPMPTLQAYAGDGYVTLTWDGAAELAFDPVTNVNDFEGYRVYRSTDPTFLDPQVISTGTGTGPIGNGKPIAQFDLVNDISGFSVTTVEGVAYFLGSNKGIKHTFTDTTVTNGQKYFYAVTSYDRGTDSLELYPSENAISVNQTLKGGTILPKNVVELIPNPPVLGYIPAKTNAVVHDSGFGFGSVNVIVKNSNAVPNNHIFKLGFSHSPDSVKASDYFLIDLTSGNDTLFFTGRDFVGDGSGPIGKGLLPIVKTIDSVEVDTVKSNFTSGSNTNVKLYGRSVWTASNLKKIRQRRIGFPYNVQIVFSDLVQDTSVAGPAIPAKPVKFKVFAKTPQGDLKLRFRVFDSNNSGTMDLHNEYIEVITYDQKNPNVPIITWKITLDTAGQAARGPIIPPTLGDVYNLTLKLPFSSEDVFTFLTEGQKIDKDLAAQQQGKEKPYVVPNPYVGAASFEPQRFAVSGRGERRLEFRGLPQECTIRIYTITGELVQKLEHNGVITQGFVAWDLRTKDNLEIAPGLYIFHVEAENYDSYIGKFAIIK